MRVFFGEYELAMYVIKQIEVVRFDMSEVGEFLVSTLEYEQLRVFGFGQCVATKGIRGGDNESERPLPLTLQKLQS